MNPPPFIGAGLVDEYVYKNTAPITSRNSATRTSANEYPYSITSPIVLKFSASCLLAPYTEVAIMKRTDAVAKATNPEVFAATGRLPRRAVRSDAQNAANERMMPMMVNAVTTCMH